MNNVEQEPMLEPDELALAKAVNETYDQFAAEPSFSIDDETRSHAEKVVATICERPEIRPLVRGICFRVVNKLGVPFRTLDSSTIELDRAILDQTLLAAFHVRHGLELAMWYRVVPDLGDPVNRLVCAIVGFHTAFSYYEMTLKQKNQLTHQHPQDWMKMAYDIVHHAYETGCSPTEITSAISQYWERLLPLQGIDPEALDTLTDQQEVLNQACEISANALPLALPSEQILTIGGDNRLLIDDQTSLNQYGCSPKPRPWAITFSSCTASSISDIGYHEAEWLRESLLAAPFYSGLSDYYIGETERLRRELAYILKIDRLPGTEVIFASSGTDGELYALYFALANHDDPLLNILIAPNEIGSGSLPAAKGLHFDSCTPVGEDVALGTPVEGLPTKRVRVETLGVRRESGEIVPTEEIDQKVASLVSQAILSGHKVLIHLLDCSKTGLDAPSIEAVCRLKEVYGSSVWVVVDAAQMRLSRDVLRTYIENEFLVLITGSKFFTGPPFSGALVVPPALARQVDELPPFPAGFANFATQYDFPPRWSYLASQFPDYPNVGLLLRWQSALWEMKAFYSVPVHERYQTIQSFGKAVIEMIEKNPDVELVAAPEHDRGYGINETRWDQLPTIFTFFLKKKDVKEDRTLPLTYDEARRAYLWLNMDIAGFLPLHATERERNISAKRCHIAQPVRIIRDNGEWRAALRMAAGARLVSGVKFDHTLGTTPKESLATEIHNAGVVLEKLSIIAQYWNELNCVDIDSDAA